MKNKSNLFKILEDNKPMLVLDTETTGLGNSREPAEMIEFSGIKMELKRDISISFNSDKEVVINFNGISKKFNYEKIIMENSLKNEYVIKLNDQEELIIKNNIPVIKEKKILNGIPKIKYILPFNSVGEFKEIEVIDEMYKTKTEIEPKACVVHKIYDKEYINNQFKEKTDKEQKDYINILVDEYKKKYIDTEKKIITESIKETKNKIKKYEKINENSNVEPYLKENKDYLLEMEKNRLKELEEELKQNKIKLESIKEVKSSKIKTSRIKNLLKFFKINNFRDNSDKRELTQKNKEEYRKLLNDENLIKFGHNVFTFDIKNIMEPKIGKINNYSIIDTMFFNMEIKQEKKRPRLDGIVTNAIKNRNSFFEKEYKKELSELSKLVSKEKNEEIKKSYNNIKYIIENKIFENLPLNSKEKEILKKSINVLSQHNIHFEYINMQVLNKINDFNNLVFERKGIHTALLDIKLNTLAFEDQIKTYIQKYGFEDIFTEDVNIHNIDEDSLSKVKVEDNFKLEGLLGLQTDYTNGVIATNNQIIEKSKELELKKVAISDDNLTNFFNTNKLFKENEIDNLVSFKVKLIDENIPEKYNNVTLLFPNKEDYFNSILLIYEYKLTLEELKLIINKTNTKIFIEPEIDNLIKNKNVFVKVSPYKDFDYSNTNFQNKRVLWMNNKYVEKSQTNKTLQYLWDKILNNKTINPITLNSIYNEKNKYQDYHILSKEELLTRFPLEDYSDIYENTNEILEESNSFNVEAEHIPLIPKIEHLIDNLKEVPKTANEYKELLTNKLKEQWKKKDIDNLIKIKSIKNYFLIKNDYYDSLSLKEIENLSPYERDFKKFIEKTEFSKLNKQEILNIVNNIFLAKNLKTKEDMKKAGKTSQEIKNIMEFREFYAHTRKEYGDRVKYELNALANFPNYETVFNYYFLMDKILKACSKKGISHGPGRGSAAGSIISYLMDITDIDPVDDGLLFERFLNPERVSMPDIDIDLPMSENITKDTIINILEEEFKFNDKQAKEFFKDFGFYDEEIVEKSLPKLKYNSKIATVTESSNKTIFGDTFRLLGVPFNSLNSIKRQFNSELDIEENINNIEEVDSYLNTLGFLLDDLSKLKGLANGYGKHAGGVRIPGGPVNSETPLNEGNTTTFTKDTERNEAKMDLLGLNTQLIVDELKQTKEVSQITNKIEELDYNFSVFDDSNIFKLIQEGKTANVFQIESEGMTKMLKDLSISDFDTLVTAIALYRPGPMSSGDVQKYIIQKYLHMQKKYKKYFDLANIPFKPGQFNIEQTNKVYNLIDNDKFKKLMTKENFFVAMNTVEYGRTIEFEQKIKDKVMELTNILINFPESTDEDIIESKNFTILEEKDHIKELETIEKEFLLYFRNEKGNVNDRISKSINKLIHTVKKWEDNVLNDEIYNDITKETYGTIVYQEQIMQIATRIAGFTKGEADALRKVIAKSKKLDILKFKEKIIVGLTNKLERVELEDGKIIERNSDFETVIRENGKNINIFNSNFYIENNKLKIKLTQDKLKREQISKNFKITDDMEILELDSNIKNKTIKQTYDKKTASYLFDNIVGFGSYAFNKSHAASYARLTYIMAFYKVYYPEKFYAISLKNASVRTAQSVLREMKENTNIDIILNDINKIVKDFEYDLKNHKLYFTPKVLKSVKDEAIIGITSEINKYGEFKNLIDLRLRMGSTIDKATLKILGAAGLFKNISPDLTPKIFYEYIDEIHEALVKTEKDKKQKLKSYLKTKEEKDLFIKYIEISLRDKKNNVYKEMLDEQFKLLNSVIENDNSSKIEENSEIETGINNNDQENTKSYEEIKLEIEKIEKKIKPLTKEEKENLKKALENNEVKKLINEYFYSNEENMKELIIKIENEIENEERLERFKEFVKNKTTFNEIEQDEINLEIFSSYNMNDIKIDISNRKMENIEEHIKNYYNSIIQELQSNEMYKYDDVIQKLTIPYYKVGSNPKILVMMENDIFAKSGEIKYKGKPLYKKELSFNNKEGKEVKYFRYFEMIDGKEGKEFKFDGKTQKLQLVDRSSGKATYKNVNKEDYEVVKVSDIEVYMEEIIKNNPNLTKDNIVIMSYLPFKKAKVSTKLLSEGIFYTKLKELFQEIKPPMIMATGVELIKTIKGMHKLKRENFDTVYNKNAYHFNFEDKNNKDIKSEDKLFSKVVFYENPLGKIFRISKATNEMEKMKLEKELEHSTNELKETMSKVINKDNIILENKIKENNVEVNYQTGEQI